MALTTPGLVQGANQMLIGLKPDINLIKQFAYNISDDVREAGASVRIPFVSSTAEDYDADNSNYSHATGGLSDVKVNLTYHPYNSIPVTSMDALELAKTAYVNQLADEGMNALSTYISKMVGGLFTTSNCQGGKVVLAFDDTKSDTYNLKQLTKLRKSCVARPADTVLILDPDNYNTALALLKADASGDGEVIRDGIVGRKFGFKAIICGYDLPSGVTGALVPYTSVAIACRPVEFAQANAYPEYEVVIDPDTGFAFNAFRWTDFATGTAKFTTTCLFGADIIRKSAVKYLAAS